MTQADTKKTDGGIMEARPLPGNQFIDDTAKAIEGIMTFRPAPLEPPVEADADTLCEFEEEPKPRPVPALKLLSDLRGMFATAGVDKLASKEVIDRLVNLGDGYWKEYKNGKNVTAKQVAVLLQLFGIASGSVRTNGAVHKGYRESDFNNVFHHLLPSENGTNGDRPKS